MSESLRKVAEANLNATAGVVIGWVATPARCSSSACIHGSVTRAGMCLDGPHGEGSNRETEYR